MSNDLAATLEQGYLENRLYFAATALCCYDYFLTVGREIEFVWGGKLSFANILFFCFRYPAILNTIFVMLGYLPWPSWQTNFVSVAGAIDYLYAQLTNCVVIIRFEMAGDILILTTSALFTAMRVYALFHKNRWLFGLVLILGLVAPAISTFTFIYSLPFLVVITPTDQECDIATFNVMNSWMIGARASSVVFDGVVMVLTWWSTRRIKFPAGGASGQTNIKLTLMRDTAVYFGLLFILNVVGIGIALGHLTYIEAVSTWTAILTSVLLSRLMLDLREVTATSAERTDSSISQTIGSLGFTRGPVNHEIHSMEELELDPHGLSA